MLSEPSPCGSAPGLPPGKHDWFVFPYTIPCEAIIWSLTALGKSERQGRCPKLSLWSSWFDFYVKYSSSWFLPFNIWVFWLAGPGAGGSVYNLFHPRGLRRHPGYVLSYSFIFSSLYFLNWSFDYVHSNPRLLPSISLERGRYDVTSP